MPDFKVPKLSHLKVGEVRVPWETPSKVPAEPDLSTLWDNPKQEETLPSAEGFWLDLSDLDPPEVNNSADFQIEFDTSEWDNDVPRPRNTVRTRVDRAERHPSPSGPRIRHASEYVTEAEQISTISDIRREAAQRRVSQPIPREIPRENPAPSSTKKSPMERAAEYATQKTRWDKL